VYDQRRISSAGPLEVFKFAEPPSLLSTCPPSHATLPATCPLPAVLNLTLLFRPLPAGSFTSKSKRREGVVQGIAVKSNEPSYALGSVARMGELEVWALKVRVELTGASTMRTSERELDVSARTLNFPPPSSWEIRETLAWTGPFEVLNHSLDGSRDPLLARVISALILLLEVCSSNESKALKLPWIGALLDFAMIRSAKIDPMTIAVLDVFRSTDSKESAGASSEAWW